jgi:hypothetical protein
VSDAGSQWQRCPYCGGSRSGSLDVLGQGGPACPECGRRANTSQLPYYGVFGAVEYDFDDVTPAERTEAADLLIGSGIPYRWEDGYRLFVSPDREDEVDVLFGQTSDDEDDPENADAAQDQGEGEDEEDDHVPSDDAVLGEGDEEPAEWVADEESAQALGRLFDASDRLRHHPGDEGAAAELADATGVVLIAPLPFGMSKVLWATAGTLARQLLDLLETNAGDDDVASAADALRSVLRDHV